VGAPHRVRARHWLRLPSGPQRTPTQGRGAATDVCQRTRYGHLTSVKTEPNLRSTDAKRLDRLKLSGSQRSNGRSNGRTKAGRFGVFTRTHLRTPVRMLTRTRVRLHACTHSGPRPRACTHTRGRVRACTRVRTLAHWHACAWAHWHACAWAQSFHNMCLCVCVCARCALCVCVLCACVRTCVCLRGLGEAP
jgi:hypothetical protein